MRKLVHSALLASLLSVPSCGGEDAAAPQFPRAFTAATDSCSIGFGLSADYEQGVYVETVVIQTFHAATEPLFPKGMAFVITRQLDFSGTLLEEQLEPLPWPNEAGEPGNWPGDCDWYLGLEAGPEEWHFTGSGTGCGRSIEFVMEPLFEVCEWGNCQCGFTFAGTIR
jgi:hypothetical protein